MSRKSSAPTRRWCCGQFVSMVLHSEWHQKTSERTGRSLRRRLHRPAVHSSSPVKSCVPLGKSPSLPWRRAAQRCPPSRRSSVRTAARGSRRPRNALNSGPVVRRSSQRRRENRACCILPLRSYARTRISPSVQPLSTRTASSTHRPAYGATPTSCFVLPPRTTGHSAMRFQRFLKLGRPCLKWSRVRGWGCVLSQMSCSATERSCCGL
mmetsp:Transcript_69436/g.175029  ORF Transcript_69436/g.175029 Transcript_69436/m.175029 type:complete len:209 (-) Transcript_69436:472-1098(-)